MSYAQCVLLVIFILVGMLITFLSTLQTQRIEKQKNELATHLIDLIIAIDTARQTQLELDDKVLLNARKVLGRIFKRQLKKLPPSP